MLLFRKSVHCRRAENCLLNASACVESPGQQNGRQAIEKTGLAERKEHLVSLRWIWILLRPVLFSVRRILFSLRLVWIPHGEEEIAESFYTPLFHGLGKISDLAFLGQYGTVLNIGDLA
jgi:hypothetical protein